MVRAFKSVENELEAEVKLVDTVESRVKMSVRLVECIDSEVVAEDSKVERALIESVAAMMELLSKVKVGRMVLSTWVVIEDRVEST